MQKNHPSSHSSQSLQVSKNALPNNCFCVRVLEVKHYTDRLFSFKTERPKDFRFRSGEFVMISLPELERPIYRAYSIASPHWEESLEYFSIKVKNGPLTEHLQKITTQSKILMRKKTTGTLVIDALKPGENIYLFSTGTGFAPFSSLIRDPELYEKFKKVIVVQTTRVKDELLYATEIISSFKDHPLLGEYSKQIHFFPMTTREHSEFMGRITDTLKNGQFYKMTGLGPIQPEKDRIMICGSMMMLKETKELALSLGLIEGSNNAPGSFVVERSFVD